MSNNPAKYEVLIKRYWRSILNIVNCVGNDHYIDCSHSFIPSAHLRRKKGLSMPSAWEHPSSELIFATGATVGIDLKNFRHFAHIHDPWSMEEYLQEASRVGRDDLPSC